MMLSVLPAPMDNARPQPRGGTEQLSPPPSPPRAPGIGVTAVTGVKAVIRFQSEQESEMEVLERCVHTRLMGSCRGWVRGGEP